MRVRVFVSLLVLVGGLLLCANLRRPPVARASNGAEHRAVFVSGTVKDSAGRPIPGAMVTVTGEGLAASSVTVFSDRAGAYKTPALGRALAVERLQVLCRKTGFKQAEVKRAAAVSPAGVLRADFIMAGVDNIAEQIPASVWLSRAPDTPAKFHAAQQCAACHQFPSSQVRQFASALRGMSPEERAATWHQATQYMRELSVTTGGPRSRKRFADLDPAWRRDPDLAYLSRRVENLIVPFLVDHLPDDFSRFSLRDFKESAPTGVKGTVIMEYRLEPSMDGWYREVGVAKGSPYVWAVDTGGDRLARLDPADGSHKWLKIPGEGSIGPHTITPDANGNLWVSLEEANGYGIFDPRTETWKVFRDVLKRGEISHDFATNWQGNVAFDRNGVAWLTIVSGNQLAALDQKAGAARKYELTPARNGLKEPTLPYGAVMTSDKKHVWLTQHANDELVSFNLETLKVETVVQFPDGSAPHRMSIDDRDVLWVALSGPSQLLEYHTRTGKQIIHDLPDKFAHPYCTTWDPKRQVVWVGTINADKIYRFDPGTKQFTQYLLPSPESLLRMVAIDPATGELWTITSNKMAPKLPGVIIRVNPGEADQ